MKDEKRLGMNSILTLLANEIIKLSPLKRDNLQENILYQHDLHHQPNIIRELELIILMEHEIGALLLHSKYYQLRMS